MQFNVESKKNIAMKSKHLNYALVFIFVVFVRTVGFSQVVNDTATLKADNKDFTYKWAEPVFQTVDIDSVKQQKVDNENYLKSIELLEDRLQNNKKELKMLINQANDEARVISNERKYVADKKKFTKDEDKFLKTEKSYRDKEAKLLMVDRKGLKKLSKELNNEELRDRTLKLDEKDNKIKELESQWNKRRDDLKYSLSEIAEKEAKLDRREVEVNNRLRELDRTKSALDLKAKQLNLEKQQTKLEIKKSKALLKTN